MSTFYRSPFHLLASLNQLPFGSDVYVIPDSEYKELKRKEAEKEIKILQNRAAAYRETADVIDKDIEELQKQAGLLPSSEDSK